MASHSAQGLFDMNIESPEECLTLYDGLKKIGSKLNIDWVLRAGIVFVVSALDTYFHDKVKYRVGKYSLENLPPRLAKFTVPVGDLTKWDKAKRKGNVLRNWVTEHLSVRPLQSPQAIKEALKLVDIGGLWDTIEPEKSHREALLKRFNELVRRRNQIAHEGDREQSRSSGKKLREIEREELKSAIEFAKALVGKVETAFPK